jgi:hypothetical protein
VNGHEHHIIPFFLLYIYLYGALFIIPSLLAAFVLADAIDTAALIETLKQLDQGKAVQVGGCRSHGRRM